MEFLKPLHYNGTEAVTKSTFYGMYNRYYGSDKTYPWNLPSRWTEPPADFDLSTVLIILFQQMILLVVVQEVL